MQSARQSRQTTPEAVGTTPRERALLVQTVASIVERSSSEKSELIQNSGHHYDMTLGSLPTQAHRTLILADSRQLTCPSPGDLSKEPHKQLLGK